VKPWLLREVSRRTSRFQETSCKSLDRLPRLFGHRSTFHRHLGMCQSVGITCAAFNALHHLINFHHLCSSLIALRPHHGPPFCLTLPQIGQWPHRNGIFLSQAQQQVAPPSAYHSLNKHILRVQPEASSHRVAFCLIAVAGAPCCRHQMRLPDAHPMISRRMSFFWSPTIPAAGRRCP